MYYLNDFAALVAAVGLAVLVRLLAGRLLAAHTPLPVGITEVLAVSGQGELLEGQISALLRRNREEARPCPLLLVDCGLTQQGRKIAEALCRRWPEAELCDPCELFARLQDLPSPSSAATDLNP